MKKQSIFRNRKHMAYAMTAVVIIALAASISFYIIHTHTAKGPVKTASATYKQERPATDKKTDKRVPSKSKNDALQALMQRAPLPPEKKIAFLTFDDGPSRHTPKLLTILKKNHVKATFFITFLGSDSATKRSWVKMEHDYGQMIGVHSWTHRYSYIYASEQNFMADFIKMKKILTEIIGTEPKLLRFPGGVGNTISLRYHGGVPIMPTLLQDVVNAGMTPFDWTAGGEDANIPRPASPRRFADEVMRDIGRQKHPIILMHDTYANSVAAVPLIIARLRARGYSFAVLSPDMRPVIDHTAPARAKKKAKSS